MEGHRGTSRDAHAAHGVRPLELDLPRGAMSLISLLAMAALVVIVVVLSIPNPNMVLVAGLVIASALFGAPGGVVAAAVMMAYTLYFFSIDRSFTSFTDENLAKVRVRAFKAARDAALADERALPHLLELDREQLEVESLTDGLTGLRNRVALRRDWGRIVDARPTRAALMPDSDNFKAIDDTCGHAAGDACLKDVVEVLSAVFGSRVCYRYVGDEFPVAAPGWDLRRLEAATDTLCHGLSRVRIAGTEHVRFSGGYVVDRIAHDGALAHMVSLADESLYRARRAGRDRIVGGSLGWHVQS